jgi:hypothetical protein
MIKVKAIALAEREELEPLLVKNPDVIEQGLQVIAHQFPTDSGPLDILAVDAEATLVIIELKNEASESHLDQGLRYYDWCRQNIPWITQVYKDKVQIDPNSPPRLMLVAPAFTDTVKRIAKYIEVVLHLIEYHAFEDDQGEKGLICTEIDYGQPPTPPDIPSIEKKMEYFQDPKVKELFKTVLTELESKNVEVKPIHDLWISFWYRGKRFMYMEPKRNFFVADMLTPGGNWTGRKRISTRSEWDVIFQEYIVKYMQYLDQNR